MILLIDCNNLCHRAFHTTAGLSFSSDQTGVLFGFFNQVFKIVNEAPRYGQDLKLAFCFDSREGYLRKEIYPDYKKKDKLKTKEEIEAYQGLYLQMERLRQEILPAMGWNNNVFYRSGYEADDLIAHYSNSVVCESKMIVSSDEDMYQLLLDGRIEIYKPATHKIYRHADFFKEYGIGSIVWPKVKAIAGCSSDNIPGVKGVKEKTAIKYLSNQLKVGSKVWVNIKHTPDEIYQRNLQLVTLPFKQSPDSSEWDDWGYKIPSYQLYKSDFYDIFKQFGMKQFISIMPRLTVDFLLK